MSKNPTDWIAGNAPGTSSSFCMLSRTVYCLPQIINLRFGARPISRAPMRYSIFNLVRQALRGHRDWKPAWCDATPKPSYDVIIIGAGGHGLAAAYYLAKNHN